MQAWHTLLELKEDHKELGLKGWVYFISDFPKNIETGELDYVLHQPTFTGLGVGTGAVSFVVKDHQINEFFNVLDKTFEDYAEELKRNYFDSDE